MKKYLCPIFVLFFIIFCSDPNSSNENDTIETEYSIIFNQATVIFGEICALGIVNMDGTTKKIGEGLYSPMRYSVSTDGSIAVYVTGSSGLAPFYITVSYIDNLTDTILINTKNKASRANISPDGKEIAFYNNTSLDSLGIYIMNIDGTNIRQLLSLTDIGPIRNWDWTSDGKGIYYEVFNIPGDEYTTYYIDKDGSNNPVEIESPIKTYGPDDLEYYSLDGFQRAGIPEDIEPDSLGFYPYQFNEQKNKAWNLYRGVKFIRPTPPQVYFYLLGYDFDLKVESFLADSGSVTSSSWVSWSPNHKNIAVFTTAGLELVQIDGTRRKLIDYYIENSYALDFLLHKWIPKRG